MSVDNDFIALADLEWPEFVNVSNTIAAKLNGAFLTVSYWDFRIF